VRKVMSPATVRLELEASLRHLGIETIDLYQVHWPGDGRLLGGVGDLGSPGDPGSASEHATPIEEYWALMADLKREGKVRAIGLSSHDTEAINRSGAGEGPVRPS
jgi:aryl-alcohol dehydrogenase-like predicted oxidoreductase